MIFSLEINEKESLDVFSFFPVKNAISCPHELWFDCISTSLRNKHSVLILEAPREIIPKWDPSKRWSTGDNWSWLAPRALSTITEAYTQNAFDFSQFKVFLTSSK